MTIQDLQNQAMALHQQGRLADAETFYRQALAAGPDYRSQYLLAVLLYQQRRPEEALAAVDLALALNPGAPESLMVRGVALQAAGRATEALDSFAAVTARQPGHAEAWYNQGVVLAAMGRNEDAVAAFDRAVALVPAAHVWTNRAASLVALRRFEDALESCDRALALDHSFPAAQFNRGVALLELQKFADAVSAFDQLLAKVLDDFNAWNNRGAALQGLGKLEQALESYDRSVALKPDFAPAWKSRADMLRALSRFGDAIASYDKALALTPDDPDLWSYRAACQQMLRRFEDARLSVEKALALAPSHVHALAVNGSLLCEMGHIANGMASYAARAALLYGDAPQTVANDDLEHRKRHDAEQRDYLTARGVTPDRFHIAGGARLAGPAVNPANAKAIAAQWAGSDPRLVVIDNLLTPEALEGLRQFCWGSTIWKKTYRDGYLGAMPDHGFACPLLAQVADELRQVFPTIFGAHGLGQWWGFKYDSSLSGIRIHADQAAVNVNFWITPDDANRNASNGGLVVWDKKPPLNWDFVRSNGDEKSARDFLAQTGARPVTVPYRANRAVIFDSDLFHETDRIEFQDGYLNRRVNVTMLYGRRGDA